jgi:hypothetical protein
MSLGLQALPAPAAGIERVDVTCSEKALVADPFVKSVLTLDPQLDGFEPEAESTPEIRTG